MRATFGISFCQISYPTQLI